MELVSRLVGGSLSAHGASLTTCWLTGGAAVVLGALLIPLAMISYWCSFLPSHIHDSDRSPRTAKLASLVDELGEKSPGIYDTLLKSSRTIGERAGQTSYRPDCQLHRSCPEKGRSRLLVFTFARNSAALGMTVVDV